MRSRLAAFFGLAVAGLCVSPAAAHPHIFIDAKATILFNNDGELIGIRQAWTFDEAFSAWQIQGLDTNEDGVTSSEEMQELAEENMQGLAEYGFYTYAGAGATTLPMASMDDARFTYENGRSTLTFGVEPQGPHRIEDELEIAINDPEYYVAIEFADVSSVTLQNAPVGCSVRLKPPQTMSDELAAQLYALPPDVTLLPPEIAAELRGVQGAIIVSCPPTATAQSADGAAVGAAAPTTTLESEPSNALEAATEMAASRGAALPFGGPPPEPGFVLPKTGILGWVAEQQRSFYRALTEALGALQRDNTAFWVLGSLSFFYGVFHAAGPGHGKVVISSYVLANEQQIRRGVALSFAASMLQAVTAIAFVLVAAAVLNLTATAMGEAAAQIAIASYALVALLGLWLIARKVFGWGHSHGHEKASHATKAHAHASAAHHGHDHAHHDHHEHGHHHAVTPEQTTGTWREKMAVVLAVGLRPCSGALVVLAFSLSQGLLLAGVMSTLLMGLGTGITIAVLASLAVGLKGLAGGMAGGNGVIAARVVWWAELLGALLVLAFGVLLLLASL